MAERATDKSGLDRVLLISSADLKTRATDTGFDPLHPVYYRTEGADPFTYANRFCRMKLGTEGTVAVERLGAPTAFAEVWEALFAAVAGWKTLQDLRIYDFDFTAPPMAVGLTTYGRVRLLGERAEYAPAATWQEVRRIYWDVDGFGALCGDDSFCAVGSMAALDGTDEVSEVACSALPGHCSPVAYLLQKNGAVLLFDRKNHTVTRPRERVQQIALVKYYPGGLSTWVALSKITGHFLCSEPRDSISADYFGGDYTDIIAPNRYRQKIRSIAAVPRKYLAVLYENGYLRVFGAGYNSGDILCEDVQEMELAGDELIAYLPSDLSYAPAIEFSEDEDIANAECSVTLGDPVDLAGACALLKQKIEGWRAEAGNAGKKAAPRIVSTCRNRYYIYFLHEDGTVRAELLAKTGHSGFGENAVEDWHDIIAVVPGRCQTLGLRRDGTVCSAGRGYGLPYAVDSWRGMKSIAQSSGMAAGLRGDGSVAAMLCDSNLPVAGVEHWHDITALAVGEDYLLGLCRDGTVVAAGENAEGQCEVTGWKEITAIAVAEQTAAGLRRDGTVVTAGKSRNLRFDGMESWKNIRELISFSNGGCIFLGLTGEGEVCLAGRWNTSSFDYRDCLDHRKWSNLRHIWQDGYYLLGEKADGSIIYESTPTEHAGDPPMDEHITDWSAVADWVIGGEYLLAVRRDGTVAWEGAHRREAKRRRTDAWREITFCLLWRNAGGRSNAIGVDKGGRLWSDMMVPGIDAAERQKKIDAFFGAFTGVKSVCVFDPFLLVLHGECLSFVLLQDGAPARIDLAGVSEVLPAEEGKTAVVCFTDGRVRSFGRTVYCSTADANSSTVKLYGDRADYSEEAKKDPFCSCDGILGVQPDGKLFVLSQANEKEKESFYSVQDLLYFDTVTSAVDAEPMGDILLADGTCVTKRGDLFAKWVGIRQLSSCFTHAVGVTTFNTVVVRGDGEYGSCSVDAYMGVAQAFSFPHATVLLLINGELLSLCEKLSETPYEPLPVNREVAAVAKTGSRFAILCRSGELWCCEAQAFADKIRWRGSSEYYTRPWGSWKLLFKDATRMTVTGECIRVWRNDKSYSYMEPTLEQNTLTGCEPTLL